MNPLDCNPLSTSARHDAKQPKLVARKSLGGTQGVSIQWIHYHLSNDDGRRVVLAFTFSDANLELFAAEDAQLADSFELINWPTKLDAKALESASTETPAAGAQPTTLSGRPKMSR